MLFTSRLYLQVADSGNHYDSGAFIGGQVVRATGIEPVQAFRPYGFSYQLRLSPPPTWRLWSGLSLHRGVAAVGAARLVSTPSCCQAWLGITNEGFPEFEQFCIRGFPRSTQWLKSVASTNFATPACHGLHNPIATRSPRELRQFALAHFLDLLFQWPCPAHVNFRRIKPCLDVRSVKLLYQFQLVRQFFAI